MTTRAAVYLRISLDATGEQLAVERQLQDCMKIVDTRGWQLVGEPYRDNSISASKRNVKRPSYDRMVADFEAGLFDALVCYDLDRLTRQPRQLEDWIEAAERSALQLVTANGEADLTTDGGRTYARVKLAFARGEIERKSERQKRAPKQRAELGKPPLGTRPFGYTATVAEVIPAEAKEVKWMFESFEEGEPLTAIARALNLRNVPTRRGGPWTPSSVSTILKNDRYAATDKNWKPIVTDTLYRSVQRRLADSRRITNREGTARKWLGSGLYECGPCHIEHLAAPREIEVSGDGMREWEREPEIIHPKVRTNGKRYWCPKGSHVIRSIAHVDYRVLTAIRERLAQPDVYKMLRPNNNVRVQALSTEIDTLRGRLAQFEDDYDNGLIDGKRLSTAKAKTAAQLQPLDTERFTLTSGSVVSDLLSGNDPVTAFDAASLAVKRTIIDALVTVILYPGKQGSRVFHPQSVFMAWHDYEGSENDFRGVVPDRVGDLLR